MAHFHHAGASAFKIKQFFLHFLEDRKRQSSGASGEIEYTVHERAFNNLNACDYRHERCIIAENGWFSKVESRVEGFCKDYFVVSFFFFCLFNVSLFSTVIKFSDGATKYSFAEARQS